jgi:hypothetical protein
MEGINYRFFVPSLFWNLPTATRKKELVAAAIMKVRVNRILNFFVHKILKYFYRICLMVL